MQELPTRRLCQSDSVVKEECCKGCSTTTVARTDVPCRDLTLENNLQTQILHVLDRALINRAALECSISDTAEKGALAMIAKHVSRLLLSASGLESFRSSFGKVVDLPHPLEDFFVAYDDSAAPLLVNLSTQRRHRTIIFTFKSRQLHLQLQIR